MEKQIQTADLRKILAFRFLKDAELQDIFPKIVIKEFAENTQIIAEGTDDTLLYFLYSGTVNVMVTSTNQNQAYIAVLGEGESFSESGIFPKMSRSAAIITASPSTVLVMDRKDLLQFIAHFPAGGTKLLMMLIYSLLKKLRMVNRELAFERVEDGQQDEIDTLVNDFMNEI